MYGSLTLLGERRHCVEDVDGVDEAVVTDAALHTEAGSCNAFRAQFDNIKEELCAQEAALTPFKKLAAAL